jgi:hypothetical protein
MGGAFEHEDCLQGNAGSISEAIAEESPEFSPHPLDARQANIAALERFLHLARLVREN